MTVEEALRQAETELTGIFQIPRMEAELLLMGILRCSRVDLLTRSGRILEPAQLEQFLDWLHLRKLDYPLQYLRGDQEFFGRRFMLSPEVLIPRPDSEILVEIALGFLAARTGRQRIVDVGTGSGCLAVTLCCEVPSLYCLATDLHLPGLRLARKNRDEWNCRDRIDLVCGDGLSFLEPFPGFDLIVSNPPYIREGDRPGLQAGVRDFEPPLALFAGPEGMDVYQKLFQEAPSVLKPGGGLMVEIGSTQEEAVCSLAAGLGWKTVRVEADLAGHPRVVSLRSGSD